MESSTDAPSLAFIQPSIDVVNTLYLHHQVETISNSLAEISVSQTFANEEPNENYLLPFKTVISAYNMGPSLEDAHREVVAKTLEIIRLLKGDSADLSVQDGAWEMVNLAIKLYGLEMYSDAEAMGYWTVTMYRALVAVNPTVYTPYLTLSLRNLSRYRAQIKDNEGAAAVVNECLDLQRRLVDQNPTLEGRSQLVNTLCEYWSVITKQGDTKKGMEIAEEAIGIADSIRAEIEMWEAWLASSPSPRLQFPDANPVEFEEARSIETPIHSNWDADETMWLEYNTARALCCLAFSLQDHDRLDDAYETQLHSLAIYQALAEKDDTFMENIAASYAHLSSPDMRKGHPNDQSLVYAERAVEIYRVKKQTQPLRHSIWLLESLWDYATLLQEAGRADDVLRVSTEALELIRETNKNRKLLADALQTSSAKLRNLKQNDTAVVLSTEAVSIYRTLSVSDPSLPQSSASVDSVGPTVVPDALMDLAHELIVAGKLDDAVVACREAVDIYRGQSEEADASGAALNLARSLSYLCYCTWTAKDYDSAAKIGNDAIRIYRDRFVALGTEFKDVANYVAALRRTAISSYFASDTRALVINAAVIEDLQMLIVDHKEAVGKLLMATLHDRDFLLGKHRRPRECIWVNEQMLKLIGPLPITDPDVAANYITAADSYSVNLYDVGRVKDSLQAMERAIELGRSFSDDAVTKDLGCAMAQAYATQAAHWNNFGRYVEAEDMIKLSLDATRVHFTPVDDTILACRYRCYAVTLRSIPGRLEEALELGEKAVVLCRGSTSAPVMFTDARLPYTLESYAASVADSGDILRALSIVQESVERYRKLRIANDPLIPWSYAEPIYAEALSLLGSCLMADGDQEGAYEVLIECETIYRDLIVSFPGYFADYMKCLDLLAVNRDALGLDDQMKGFLQDQRDRQQAMEVFNPELGKVARLNLEQLRRSPFQMRLRTSLKALDDESLGSGLKLPTI
ncbi:hypothetical protein H0H87_001535 [Tephrocybe sp. NHM501043]|nr:hypothetical protein H0H87_001535 [Tephrocybe sp. NHM501043]